MLRKAGKPNASTPTPPGLTPATCSESNGAFRYKKNTLFAIIPRTTLLKNLVGGKDTEMENSLNRTVVASNI